MTDAIGHRGPDDEGQWVEENVGLGNRRLAIIDLSPKGHMPMFYGRNRYVITFNGEIYNFQSEQKKLIKKGYEFRSNSDTEVILALYSEYGVKCLDHLRGMFAFAIWDRKDKVLFAARDRTGQKPLKYYIDKDKFIFASELKAILTQAGVKRIPDYKAIYHYLSFQYVPSPWTGFEKIFKLPPAHYLVLKNNVLSIHKYWELDYTKKLEHSEDEWKELVAHKLNESVRLRMIADVPIGAFLSGGVSFLI
jgi:asparagine synthase (glutamine-hydrolysing)